MKEVMVLCFLILLTIGCRKKTSEGYKLFKIKAGKHFANGIKFNAKKFSKNQMSFNFKLNDNCKYSHDNSNQLDINKLYGITESLNHHKNSARLGYRYNDRDDIFEYFAYVYCDGERIVRFLAASNEATGCRIMFSGGEYNFFLRTKGKEYQASVKRKAPGKFMPKFILYPYFGGDEFAPHDMTIMVKELY